MKLFCSNAFTGENFDAVQKRMKLVVEAIDESGHESYCPIFDPHKIVLQEKGDTKAIFEYALQNIERCDGMVAIITSERKSEGQLIEIGAILAAKKPLFVFAHESAASAPSHLSKLATKMLSWKTDEDLKSLLQRLQI